MASADTTKPRNLLGRVLFETEKMEVELLFHSLDRDLHRLATIHILSIDLVTALRLALQDGSQRTYPQKLIR